jgi:inner membrane protein
MNTISIGRGWLLASLMTIFVVDAYLWLVEPPLILDGLTDWAAHAATAILALALLPRVTRRFAIGALIGAVLIDLDHLPQYLGTDILTKGTPRPYTHSLLMLSLVALAAWRTRGDLSVFLAGAAFGLVTHLIRDMAEPGQNGGVALFWPISDWGVTLPYVAYAAAVIIMFLLAWWKVSRSPRESRASQLELTE